MKRALIAYGTKTGTTKETAIEIGKELSSKGIHADVKAFSEAEDLSGYDGFVIGAPVLGMQWMPDALAFISKNKAALEAKPTAYFLHSVVMSGGRPSLQKIIPRCFNAASTLVPPACVASFGGRMYSDPPFALRLMFGIKKDCPRDGRNWDVIRAWAREVAARI